MSKLLEEQRVLTASNERRVNCTIRSTSNNIRSKQVEMESTKRPMRFEKTNLQDIAGSLGKMTDDHGAHEAATTEISLEKSTTIDSTIVNLDAIKTSTYANKAMLNKDATTNIARSYPTKKDEENKRDSMHYPLIAGLLFAEGIGEQMDTFVPCQSYLPKLEEVNPHEGDVGHLDQASDETQSESVSDHFDYDFDPFADQSHARVALEVPSSLAAFFATFSGNARLHPTPRSTGVGSPTSVLEMPNGSFAVLQQSRM